MRSFSIASCNSIIH
uniref:Uncharacterized protein n=1 Tax=Arundo donax TaxID=35708 RepID=A0A0A9C4P0_ARUDO